MSQPTYWQAWIEGMDHARELARKYTLKEYGREPTDEEVKEKFEQLCEIYTCRS